MNPRVIVIVMIPWFPHANSYSAAIIPWFVKVVKWNSSSIAGYWAICHPIQRKIRVIAIPMQINSPQIRFWKLQVSVVNRPRFLSLNHRKQSFLVVNKPRFLSLNHWNLYMAARSYFCTDLTFSQPNLLRLVSKGA